MKVKELISQLEKLNPELDVYCASDEEIPLVKDGAFIALPVGGSSEMPTKLYRDEDGILCLESMGYEHKYKIAVLHISVDKR